MPHSKYPEALQALRRCAVTSAEKSYAYGLAPWDENSQECKRLARRMKTRGYIMQSDSIILVNSRGDKSNDRYQAKKGARHP